MIAHDAVEAEDLDAHHLESDGRLDPIDGVLASYIRVRRLISPGPVGNLLEA